MCAGVRPDYAVVQRFAGLCIPNARCLSLVGDPYSFDVGEGVSLCLELFTCLVYTFASCGDELEGIVFVPAMERSGTNVETSCARERGNN